MPYNYATKFYTSSVFHYAVNLFFVLYLQSIMVSTPKMGFSVFETISLDIFLDKNKCPFSKSVGLSLTRFLLIIILSKTI